MRAGVRIGSRHAGGVGSRPAGLSVNGFDRDTSQSRPVRASPEAAERPQLRCDRISDFALDMNSQPSRGGSVSGYRDSLDRQWSQRRHAAAPAASGRGPHAVIRLSCYRRVSTSPARRRRRTPLAPDGAASASAPNIFAGERSWRACRIPERGTTGTLTVSGPFLRLRRGPLQARVLQKSHGRGPGQEVEPSAEVKIRLTASA